MDLSLGGFTIPAASLNLFDAASIIVLVPVMDRFLFPLMDRCDLRPSLLKKIGTVILLKGIVLLEFGGGGILPVVKPHGQRVQPVIHALGMWMLHGIPLHTGKHQAVSAKPLPFQ